MQSGLHGVPSLEGVGQLVDDADIIIVQRTHSGKSEAVDMKSDTKNDAFERNQPKFCLFTRQ
jgi:hypothetical protein